MSIREFNKMMVTTRGFHITLPLAIQSCICLLLGLSYVVKGHGYTPFCTTTIIGLEALSFIEAWSASILWHQFINEKYMPHFNLSVIYAVSIYILVYSQYGHNIITAVLCLMYAITNSLLSSSLSHPQVAVEKEEQKNNSRRRYSIVVPTAFFSIQYIAFGSALILSSNGKWISLAIYGIVLIYAIIWKCTLKTNTRDLLPLHSVIAVAVGLISYVICYVATKGMPSSTALNSIITVAKCTVISVYCGGMISLPMLLEITQIHQSLNQDIKNYNDQMRVLSGMNFFATILLFLSWVNFPQLSIMYLIGFVILNSFFILLARHRYEKRNALTKYSGTCFSLLFSSVAIATNMFFEFSGTWNNLKSIPIVSFKVATSVDIISLVGAFATFILKPNAIKQIADHFKKLRLLGFHLIALLIIEIIMMFVIDSDRAPFAMLVAGIEMIVDLIIYLTIKYGFTLFNSDEAQ